MTASQTPAGWYPDPSGQPGQKYWDGQQWQADVPATNAGVAPYGGAPYGGGAPGGSPYGVDAYGRPLSDKSKMAAGLLQIFLPSFGVGRFYLGHTNIAILQILASLTCIGVWWPFIDGFLILAGKVPDAQGRTLRD